VKEREASAREEKNKLRLANPRIENVSIQL